MQLQDIQTGATSFTVKKKMHPNQPAQSTRNDKHKAHGILEVGITCTRCMQTGVKLKRITHLAIWETKCNSSSR